MQKSYLEVGYWTLFMLVQAKLMIMYKSRTEW